MAWRALVLSDIQTGLSSQELTAIQGFALQPGQSDPTPLILSETMDEVRGYIAASPNVVLGAESTIPDKLIGAARKIAVWNLVTRFPTKLLATDARRKDYEDAIRQLKDVANDKFRIEVPTTVSAEVTGGVIKPKVTNWTNTARARVWRSQQDLS
jgi:phage gp36-like protein